MADDTERDPVTTATPVPPPRRSRRWLWRIFAVLILGPAIVIGLWILIAVKWSYSEGDRAGYVQKFSKKGWLCKTWEGELAMSPVPGSPPQMFPFSVKDDAVARELQGSMGKQVDLTYREHRGIPTSCFGETNYFVTNVRVIEDGMQRVPTAPVVAPVGSGSNAAPRTP